MDKIISFDKLVQFKLESYDPNNVKKSSSNILNHKNDNNFKDFESLLNTQNVKYFSYEYERITERLNELQQKITEYLLDISQVNKKN